MELTTIGQVAIRIAIEKNNEKANLLQEKARSLGYKVMSGSVGSMQIEMVIAYGV